MCVRWPLTELPAVRDIAKQEERASTGECGFVAAILQLSHQRSRCMRGIDGRFREDVEDGQA